MGCFIILFWDWIWPIMVSKLTSANTLLNEQSRKIMNYLFINSELTHDKQSWQNAKILLGVPGKIFILYHANYHKGGLWRSFYTTELSKLSRHALENWPTWLNVFLRLEDLMCLIIRQVVFGMAYLHFLRTYFKPENILTSLQHKIREILVFRCFTPPKLNWKLPKLVQKDTKLQR